MNDDIAIKVEHVTKTFREQTGASSVKQSFVNLGKKLTGKKEKKLHHGDFTALKNISFEVKKGEFFGIVGRNGGGKSTLLKTIAGVYSPTKGAVTVNGKLTPFIELGVGFNPELSGRDNVYLNAALLGFTRKQTVAMYDDIVDFAELNEFMDVKLKNYSSGMQVRLAFSVAIRAQSAILILDEVLAVGDAIFQKKCFDYFKKLKKEKKTVIFVSHDTGALQEYCDKGVLIDKGKILYEGKIDNVISRYIELLNRQENSGGTSSSTEDASRTGSGAAKVVGIETLSANTDSVCKLFTEDDKEMVVEVRYHSLVDIEDPIYGITIFDAAGQRIFAGNNVWSHKKMKKIGKNEHVTIRWIIPNVFSTGHFVITPAIAGSGGTVIFDQVEGMGQFKIRKNQISNAYTNPAFEMKVMKSES